MKKTFLVIIFATATVLCFTSCKKDSFITSKDAYLRLSEDTLHFDTVFTSLGSTTQYLKIFNENDQKLKLSSIQLMGGINSVFKLNVDGVAGINFNDIELEANDSLYLFTTVKINPNTANLPFIVRDSIQIQFNGNTKWIQLQAYGKNARFINNVIVTNDSTITNDTPIVIIGSLTVNENKTLTIEPGTNIYVDANAPINIYGKLNAVGDTNAKIIFQGIRIDDPYKNYLGSWPGLYFREKSKDNMLQYCVIKNSYQGVVAIGASVNSNPKVTLKQCVLDNIYDVAIGGINSNIAATNCLISNVGFGLNTVSGGTYNVNHCTFVSISNDYLSHKNSLINLSNTNSDKTVSNSLNVIFNNSIIYGEGGLKDDEIDESVVDGSAAFNVTFNNTLFKQKTTLSNTFSNCLPNENPLFDSINTSNHFYNFRLQNNSPCIDAAGTSALTLDFTGNQKLVGVPEKLGC